MSRRIVLAALIVVIATGVAAAFLAAVARSPAPDVYRGSRPPRGIELEPFSLRSYRSGVVSSEQLKGKVVALTFLESKCRQACPVIAFDVARGVERLTVDERRQVRAIAISVHPGDDTPENVRAFLTRRRAVGRLDYLIGSEAELRPVWRRYDVLSALESGDANTHSASVHVYDRDGIWVSSLHPGIDLTPENFAYDVRVALDSTT